MSEVMVLRRILKLEENTLTVYGPAGTEQLSIKEGIFDLFCPPTPPFQTLTSEPAAHYSGDSLSPPSVAAFPPFLRAL